MKKVIAGLISILCLVGSVSAGQEVWNMSALGNLADLTTPTALQKYPLGIDVAIYDDSYKAIKKYKYVYASTALSQYNVYQIQTSSAAGEQVKTGTPTSTYLAMEFGVPQVAFTSNYYGFVQTKGDCNIAVASNTTVGYGLRSETGTTTSSTTASGVQAAGVIAIAKGSTYYSTGVASAVLLGVITAAQ